MPRHLGTGPTSSTGTLQAQKSQKTSGIDPASILHPASCAVLGVLWEQFCFSFFVHCVNCASCRTGQRASNSRKDTNNYKHQALKHTHAIHNNFGWSVQLGFQSPKLQTPHASKNPHQNPDWWPWRLLEPYSSRLSIPQQDSKKVTGHHRTSQDIAVRTSKIFPAPW